MSVSWKNFPAAQKNLGRNTVLDLYRPFNGSGRNITRDNFFTDMTPRDELASEKMTIVGTVRRNEDPL